MSEGYHCEAHQQSGQADNRRDMCLCYRLELLLTNIATHM